MADLLGKPGARFFHKGMVGQLSVIKHWSQVKANNTIAFQPDCHMDFDEQAAYQELLHLNALKLGSNARPLTTKDIHFSRPVAVVSIELPHRRAGFLLPQWQTMEALKQYCVKSAAALHFDGARLFESAPYWGKTPAAVSQLCDSVYVSLYKMFGALAGGIVAGETETIEAIAPWKSRMGGDLHTLFPYAISAMMGLDHYLPRIQEFIDKANDVAAMVVAVLGNEALPHCVQSNSFQVYLPVTPAETTQRALAIARQEHKWLFDTVSAAPGNKSMVEIQIGDAINAWQASEIRRCLSAFV